MHIVLIILAFALLLIGLSGAVIPVLPGPPLSYVGLLLMQWSGYADFSIAFLLFWAVITAAVTIMDYFLPPLMVRWSGGSRAASVGSFIGTLAGIFIFPPWGFIIGPFLGALLGETINRRAIDGKAFKSATGAFLAFIVGSGAKLIASLIMIYYAIKALF